MAFIGEIKLFAGNYAPRGWRFCDGSTMDTWTNTGVYGVVAATQGENIMNDTFYLPNLKEAEKQFDNCRFIICVDGDYPNPSY